MILYRDRVCWFENVFLWAKEQCWKFHHKQRRLILFHMLNSVWEVVWDWLFHTWWSWGWADSWSHFYQGDYYSRGHVLQVGPSLILWKMLILQFCWFVYLLSCRLWWCQGNNRQFQHWFFFHYSVSVQEVSLFPPHPAPLLYWMYLDDLWFLFIYFDLWNLIFYWMVQIFFYTNPLFFLADFSNWYSNQRWLHIYVE